MKISANAELFIKLALSLFMCMKVESVTLDEALINSSPCKNSCKSNSSILCSCDAMCPVYRDCCMDSQYSNTARKTKFRGFCSSVEVDMNSIYLVRNCSETWRGRYIVKNRCHLETDFITGNLLQKLPVTNLKSNITYKNYYCAKCNGDLHVTPWNLYVDGIDDIMSVHPNITVNDILKKTRFSIEELEYGVKLKTFGVKKFFSLSYRYEVPEVVKNHIRYCHSMISSCPAAWTDAETNRLCEDYSDPIYIGRTSYRNIHCAVCNNVQRTRNVYCSRASWIKPRISSRTNMAVLLDFNFDGGNLVGSLAKCEKGQLYDSISGKCRQTVGLTFK